MNNLATLITALADHRREAKRRDAELRVQIGTLAVRGETHPAVTVIPQGELGAPYVDIKADLSEWATRRESKMQYNTCKTCGASGGRCGLLINDECICCRDTRRDGRVTLHSGLRRTDEELARIAAILE